MGKHSGDRAYLLARDQTESERLEKQHFFFMALLRNQIIQKSIPRDNLVSIADIGTGTGIWLQEVAKVLPSPQLDLQGFDISDAQFPPRHRLRVSENSEIGLHVQDARKEFPPEHHGRYDLVHIRLLTAGMKAEDYKHVVKNVRSLLKLNGYVQWEELDTTAFCTDKVPEPAVITKIRKTAMNGLMHMKMSYMAPSQVFQELRSHQFQNVQRKAYSTRGLGYLHDVAVNWAVGVIRALIPPTMIVTGEAKDMPEAKAKVEELVIGYQEHCMTVLPLVNLYIVIGQL
ncbi:uncharacterized protein N7469_010006 [Penicillium citrinum]|uniref:Methyltransferase domain-containing protein n=1 Tax=Penicillium citrinum TaxID=5077 RepID=A0A9W9TG40_PENCI|nr:uncharacterized protein N7469_010006 [Penicillium citrinum]KAJ5221119.1 hypothetical protein N7469_010006 [Penicillium citrinum]